MTDQVDLQPLAELEKLAAELNGGDYEARVMAVPRRRPYLYVRNQRAGVLNENVYSGDGWFWFGWAERIAPIADIAAAAQKIMHILRALAESSGNE